MAQVLVAGIDTSTQSTKVRVTDAATGNNGAFRPGEAPRWDQRGSGMLVEGISGGIGAGRRIG